ncbi:MAG: sucrase ferredoxin [Actinobacteria bacterium]|nr:sucrase ferredoxin [Actinomycetota bacterium]
MNGIFCVDGAAAEPLAGTAPHRPVWALVEHPGPWGREAVLDAPWPDDGAGAALAALTDAAGVRVVLGRRPGAGERGAPPRPAVVLARYGPGGWAATTTLDAPADLLDLDWAGLAAAPSAPAGWSDPGPVWGICTHGTRDACCARLGRPLAQAFADLEPAGTWEISHSGGHRFAGVALDLAAGLVYGRVGTADAATLVRAHDEGRVVRHLLRGALHRTPPAQAAEAALRDHLDEDRLAALTLLDETAAPGGGQVSTWRHATADGATTWRVTVAEEPLPPRPASCGKAPEAASAWRSVSVDPA